MNFAESATWAEVYSPMLLLIVHTALEMWFNYTVTKILATLNGICFNIILIVYTLYTLCAMDKSAAR